MLDIRMISDRFFVDLNAQPRFISQDKLAVSYRIPAAHQVVAPAYLRRADGGEERLTAGGPVIGLLEDVALESGEIALARGDLLAVVTDGVTEALDPGGDEFGYERVWRALAAGADGGAPAALAGLVSEVDSWAGAAGCTDDLTALILRAT